MNQCQHIVDKGKARKCSRKAQKDTNFCWQHTIGHKSSKKKVIVKEPIISKTPISILKKNNKLEFTPEIIKKLKVIKFQSFIDFETFEENFYIKVNEIIQEINYYIHIHQHESLLHRVKNKLSSLQNEYLENKISNKKFYFRILAAINSIPLTLTFQNEKGDKILFGESLFTMFTFIGCYDYKEQNALDKFRQIGYFIDKQINKYIYESIGYIKYFLVDEDDNIDSDYSFVLCKIIKWYIEKSPDEINASQKADIEILETVEIGSISTNDEYILNKNDIITCKVTKDADYGEIYLSLRGREKLKIFHSYLSTWISEKWWNEKKFEKKLPEKYIAQFERIQSILQINKITLFPSMLKLVGRT